MKSDSSRNWNYQLITSLLPLDLLEWHITSNGPRGPASLGTVSINPLEPLPHLSSLAEMMSVTFIVGAGCTTTRNILPLMVDPV